MPGIQSLDQQSQPYLSPSIDRMGFKAHRGCGAELSHRLWDSTAVSMSFQVYLLNVLRKVHEIPR